MIIRELRIGDLDKLREIHHKFYEDEFPFPEVKDKFLFAVIIANDAGEIVSFIGARPIVELIAITDRSKPISSRVRGFKSICQALKWAIKKLGYDQVHAFIQDEKWLKCLKKSEFQDCKGKAIYMDL